MNLLKGLSDDIQTFQYTLVIFFNVVLNVFLICQIVKRKHFYQSPKYTVILSMAVADILQAELPFMIRCKKTFMLEDDQWTDIDKLVSKFYINHFVHFVYGFCLILLGAELLTRQKFKGYRHKSLLAGIACCIPWAVGVLAVWLVFMIDKSYDYYISQRSQVLTSAVCVFLPAISCTIMCSVLFVTHFWAVDQDAVLIPGINYSTVLKDIASIIFGGAATNNIHCLPAAQHKINLDTSITNHLTTSSAHVSSSEAHARNSDVFQHQRRLTTSSAQVSSSEIQATNSDVFQDQRHLTKSSAQVSSSEVQVRNSEVFQDKRNLNNASEIYCDGKDVQRDVTHMIKQSILKEIYELLALSLIYSIMVIPFHIFSLVETMDHESIQYKLTLDVLRWIMFARSFITPFIMVRFSAQQKFIYVPSFEMIISTKL